LVHEGALVDNDYYTHVIKQEEGFVPYAYACPAGYVTVGYGFNIDEENGGRMPREVADYWLARLTEEIEDDLISIFGPPCWAIMTPPRRATLMSMRYQLGGAGFRRFKKMIRCITSQDWDGAARECMDSKSARNPKLRGRFMRNADALRTGKDQWA
jgi:lysozyme